MHLQKLTLQHFRNYSSLSITVPPEGALFEGANGAGKTNVLESVHLLCTGRSQRGAARGDMIAVGQDAAYVEGEFCSSTTSSNNTAATTTTAAIGFSRDKKVVMKHDGHEIKTYSEWLGKYPVVSFGTDDLDLIYGAPEARRRFVDMLLCQVDRAYLDALLVFRKNMACRNALLGKTNDAAQFEIYEQIMAKSAAALVFARTEVTQKLRASAQIFYAEICGGGEKIDVEYAPKIKENFNNFSDVCEWQNVYLDTLYKCRHKDAELAYTTVGPHRDDLRFFLNGRGAKSHASQGQCRTFALALKLAAVSILEERRGGGMIFLVDDAVSELDEHRTSRAYPLLHGRGQIFIATPRCHAKIGDGVMRCTVENGNVKIT